MQVHLLPLTWTDLRRRYTYAEVWPQLSGADLATALLVLSAPDFQAYDWPHHELWLTPGTGARLARSGALQWLRNPSGQAFVVTLDGERLYGGLCYPEVGAAALGFPVMHALGPSGTILRIRPALGAAAMDERFAPQRDRIADPRLAAWLRTHGLFRDEAPGERPVELPLP